MSTPVVIVASGGVPIVEALNGLPVTGVPKYGFAVTVSPNGRGTPVTFTPGTGPGPPLGQEAYLVNGNGEYIINADNAYITTPTEEAAQGVRDGRKRQRERR
jgi:hypothetical protein